MEPFHCSAYATGFQNALPERKVVSLGMNITIVTSLQAGISVTVWGKVCRVIALPLLSTVLSM